jgi:hypothetical protein
MQPLDRIPELVRVDFRNHDAISKGFRREPRLPRLDPA